MYTRYIAENEGYTPVSGADERPSGPGPASPDRGRYIRAGGPAQGANRSSGTFFSGTGVLDGLKLGKLGELFDRDKSGGGLGGLLGALGLEDLDSGDILLLLIILFLLLEGDDLERIITIGLILLLGLSGRKEKGPDSGGPSGQEEQGEAQQA